MEWHFHKDNQLLLFPGMLFVISLIYFSQSSYQLGFRLILVAWAVFFFIFFYRLHLNKSLQSSVRRLRFVDDGFQVLFNDEWLPVELARGSLISYWLLALQWRVVNDAKPLFRKSFSLVVRQGSMKDSEFRELSRVLNQH